MRRTGWASSRNRLALFSLTLSVLLASQLTPADAQSRASFLVPGTMTVSSTSFMAYPLLANTDPNPLAPLTLLNSASKQFFFVKNGGNRDLTAFTMTISVTPGTTVALTRCDINVLFTANNTCATGTQTIVYGNTTAPVVTTISLSIPVGSWYHFQETPGKKTVPTVNISLSSSQIVHFATNS